MKHKPPRYMALPKFEALSPYNWDFRAVPEGMLEDAIFYEYLREWREFRDAADRWFAKRVQGRTIRNHLMDEAMPVRAAANDGRRCLFYKMAPKNFSFACLVEEPARAA